MSIFLDLSLSYQRTVAASECKSILVCFFANCKEDNLNKNGAKERCFAGTQIVTNAAGFVASVRHVASSGHFHTWHYDAYYSLLADVCLTK